MLRAWSVIKLFIYGLAFAVVCTFASPLHFKTLETGEYAEFSFKDVTYGVYHTPIANVSLHWQDNNGKAYGRLSVLKRALSKRGKQPVFLMNAGIYTQNHQPAGLWIENGDTLRPLNTRDGLGNFHIQPNGVFFIDDNRAQILTTEAYTRLSIQPKFAVQSGPMLVVDGQINSHFIKGINSPYKRNSVCITNHGQLYFIMSTAHKSQWPNFYDFAQALLSVGCEQALYLDGSISAWYIKNITKSFHWHTFVGIIAVTTN